MLRPMPDALSSARPQPDPLPGPLPDPLPDLGGVASAVLGIWTGLAAGLGALPSRRDVDPARFPPEARHVVPHLWLLDVERDPWRFRLRLIGGALKSAGSPAKPGDYLDSVDRTGEVGALLREVCVSRAPAARRGRPVLPHGGDVDELEVLYLPLASDGATVDAVLCCTEYRWRGGRGPAFPRLW